MWASNGRLLSLTVCRNKFEDIFLWRREANSRQDAKIAVDKKASPLDEVKSEIQRI
jgi:hypothetical protein